jgi:hypothetical protein
LERPPRQSKRNLACPAIPRASLQLGTLCARESRAGRTTCDYDRKGGLSCGVGRPPVSAVVRDLPVGCGPDVAPGSRAWKALSRARLGPAPTPNWEVRADLHEPWLTARDRSCPFARARRGHGWLGQDHSPVVAALGLAWVQVRPNLGDHLAGAPQGASVAPVARCAWFRRHTLRPRAFHPGPRGAASLGGLSPADPSSPAPPISPGRAGPRLMPWTWSRQTPPGTGPQKYPALGQLLWSQRVGRPGRCHRSAGRQSVAKPPAGGRGGLHPFGHSCPWGVRRCGVARGSVRRIVVNGKVVSIGHHYVFPPCWPGNLALWLG